MSAVESRNSWKLVRVLRSGGTLGSEDFLGPGEEDEEYLGQSREHAEYLRPSTEEEDSFRKEHQVKATKRFLYSSNLDPYYKRAGQENKLQLVKIMAGGGTHQRFILGSKLYGQSRRLQDQEVAARKMPRVTRYTRIM